VTKWLKGSPEGLLGNVRGICQGDKAIRDEPMGELERQVEVRFEWTRMERWKEGSSENGDRYVSKNASRRSGVALTSSNNPSVNPLPDKDKKVKRSSAIEGT